MAANMYDQPALAKFIDTYVPIPFLELYTLGTLAKLDVEKAAADLSSNIQKWSEFRSPSAVDTQRFYDLSIGLLKDDIEALASNPDLLKTAEGRHRIQSKINNLDYSTLSNLKQSAENLSTREKMIADMRAKGLYNEAWDDINIGGWDTSTSGIMNELSPILYKSLHDIAAPYSQALKDSYLGKRDGFTYWTGVDEKAIRNSIDSHYADFINTPQGRMHMRDIENEFKNAGIDYSPSLIKDEFVNRMVQSQKDYLRKNINVDTAALTAYTAALRRKGSTETPSAAYSPREQLSATVRSEVDKKLKNSKYFGPNFSSTMGQLSDIEQKDYTNILTKMLNARTNYQKAMASGNEQQALLSLNAYNKWGEYLVAHKNKLDYDKYSIQAEGFRKALSDEYGIDDINKLGSKRINRSAFNKASTAVLDAFSAKAPYESIIRNFNLQDVPSTVTLNGANIQGFKSNSRDLIFPNDLMADLADVKHRPGLSIDVGYRDGFIRGKDDPFIALWRTGSFKDITFVPEDKVVTYTNKNGETIEAAKVKAYIPEEAFKNVGYQKAMITDPFNPGLKRTLEKDLNATIETDADGNRYYVIEAYKPMELDAQTRQEYDREASNKWYGSKVSDADRDYQIENAFDQYLN